MKITLIFSVISFVCFSLNSVQTAEEAFTTIYEQKIWGTNDQGEGSSGSGSTKHSTAQYRAFLQKFFRDYDIHTVVDFGCGDWEFSQFINWEGIHYIGLDVVKSVIEKNQKKFTNPNINFIHANGLEIGLPEADLLICKDVLQHLTNQDIAQFLGQLNKFRYCLITNDVHPRSKTSSNPDIVRGNHRLLDLTEPPFNIKGIKIFSYAEGRRLKQVLLIKSNRSQGIVQPQARF